MALKSAFALLASSAIILGSTTAPAAAAKTFKFTVMSSSRLLPVRSGEDPTHRRYSQDISTYPAVKGAYCTLAYEQAIYNNNSTVILLQNFSNSVKTDAKGKASIIFTEGTKVKSAMDVYAACTYKGYTASDDPSMAPGQLAYVLKN